MSPSIRHLALAAFGAASLAAIAPAAAQYPPPGPPPPPYGPPELPPRVGVEAGFGLYGGEINCEDQGDSCGGLTEAGGFDVHVTNMFSPTFGLTFDFWPMVHAEDGWTFTHTVVTVGAKWRPLPILSLTAGVGGAQARLRYDGILADFESRSETAPAVFLSAGLEVLRGRSFAIDVSARMGAGFYGDDDDNDGEPDVVARNVGLGVGFTWF